MSHGKQNARLPAAPFPPGDVHWVSRESSSVADNGCGGRTWTCLPGTSGLHPLFMGGEFGVTTAFPLDSDLSYAASSRPDFPLLLFCLLFVFHRRGGSFLGIWCPQTYREFSIGIFMTFPETRAVFLLAALRRKG